MPAPRVALRPMKAGEFRRYLKSAIPGYAQAHIRAGDVDPKQALRKAKAEYASLLPDGLASPGHHLYAITLAGKAIGMVWFELKQRHGRHKAFIFDFMLAKAQRGKGLGAQSMVALEREAGVLGAEAIELHVFGDNLIARALYEKCGYRYTGMHMLKDLC